MKKIIAFLLVLMFTFSYASADSPTTPTDLYEFEDDDWGEITITFERKVYININKDPISFGDTVIFTAILVNFKESDKVTFHWQYALELPNWMFIEGENEQTYTFILNKENCLYWYRVIVEILED